ncbi:hypothetical protein [Microbacterium oleivorans]|uniref:hypothetical protein n=1 Tax=Microbacterium oleivorans TaxID=273677 RepID=UPI002115D427|nr:hypothetical protein [Microbacterium oleivorans]
MTNRFSRRALSITGAAVLTLAVALMPQAALAATPEPAAPETISETAPMVVGGYDAAVAEANGFKIVTHEDGTQESVPVTEAAAAQLQQADQRRAEAQLESAAADPVPGNCGSSWASGSKRANDTVAFSTGFIVFLAAYEHDWRVYANGFISGNYWSTGGAGPSTGSKSWTGAIPGVVGPGIGGVPAYSASASVILVDGTVCYSVGPTFTFG